MEVARQTVRLGLAARAQATIKIRQPLRAAVVVATGYERDAIERLADLVREELNVRELQFVSEADELGQVELKPNYRTLGPRFGKQMPKVALAVAALDAAHAVALETTIDESLRTEGWARDIVRAVQNARQAAGLDVSDRILLTLDGDAALLDAARRYEAYLTNETLATTIGFEDLDGTEPVLIDGRPLKIAVALTPED
jgi:isoleucyl-tRNA synthetase